MIRASIKIISKTWLHVVSISSVVYCKFNSSAVPVGYFKKPNFGDLLTPLIFNHFDIKAIHVPKFRYAKAIGVGSLIHMSSPDFQGVFLGSGLISDEKLTFKNAQALLVRGNKTVDNLSLPASTLVGDPGLLIADVFSEFRSTVKPVFEFGIIPHYVDKDHPALLNFINSLPVKSRYVIIDVRKSPKEVFMMVAKCKIILSSSLHGLITADSLEIPNVWIKISQNIIGQEFKFLDYYSSFDEFRMPFNLEKISVKDISTLATSRDSKKLQKVKLNIYSAYERFKSIV